MCIRDRNDDRVIDHEMTGWGECYLKVFYDDQVYDHSTLSEGLGNRIGIKGMERMYQKFKVPTLSQILINHDFCDDQGWQMCIRDRSWIWKS